MTRYVVEVTVSTSVTVEVDAASAADAVDAVATASFPLPPADEWSRHKDWRYHATSTVDPKDTVDAED